MWFPHWMRNYRYDLCMPASGEVQRVKLWPLSAFRRSDQSLCHCQLCLGLWKILAKVSCPEKFIIVVRFFHEGMMAESSMEGNTLGLVTLLMAPNSVVSWHVPCLASCLQQYFMLPSETLTVASPPVSHWLWGLQPCTLQAKTKITELTLCDFMFANDCTCCTQHERCSGHHRALCWGCCCFGLCISI